MVRRTVRDAVPGAVVRRTVLTSYPDDRRHTWQREATSRGNIVREHCADE
jgi:hypothetical protein